MQGSGYYYVFNQGKQEYLSIPEPGRHLRASTLTSKKKKVWIDVQDKGSKLVQFCRNDNTRGY